MLNLAENYALVITNYWQRNFAKIWALINKT